MHLLVAVGAKGRNSKSKSADDVLVVQVEHVH